MKALFIQAGGTIDYVPGDDTPAGSVVVTNGRIGVTKQFIKANELGALHTQGIFKFAKTSDDIGDGVACYWKVDGDPVEGTEGTGAVTTTKSNNIFLGYSVGAAGVAVAEVAVELFPGAAPSVTVRSQMDNKITDPGPAGAIPVKAGGYVALETAAAETRTLADPSFVGQELLIFGDDIDTSCTITVATAFDDTPYNTIAVTAKGEGIKLIAVSIDGDPVWRVAASFGVLLSNV